MTITKDICEKLSDNVIVKMSLTDIDYFLCLYNRYEIKLLRYIKRISGASDEQAKDILQESFIKIWQNLNNFNQRLKLSSWIYRIVHNETISCWRNNMSFGKDHQVQLDDNFIDNFFLDLELDEYKHQNEIHTHLILEQLPIKYKTVLVLRYMEEMSYNEISNVLKIPEGTVAARINRAKSNFIKIASINQFSF